MSGFINTCYYIWNAISSDHIDFYKNVEVTKYTTFFSLKFVFTILCYVHAILFIVSFVTNGDANLFVLLIVNLLRSNFKFINTFFD